MKGFAPSSTEPHNKEALPSSGLCVRLSCGTFSSEVDVEGASSTKVSALVSSRGRGQNELQRSRTGGNAVVIVRQPVWWRMKRYLRA
mmetsp:Transcript_3093/g.14556  ORF Transcript_3093/g.14556 Transcript_3093/m.14556 type:complete len:87 (+) Transcript_3093:446-706(+)